MITEMRRKLYFVLPDTSRFAGKAAIDLAMTTKKSSPQCALGTNIS